MELHTPIYLATADVKDLYPSIPIEDGLAALHWVLTWRANWDAAQVQYIMDLAEFVLRNNIFTYNNQLYIQIFGTAMGTCFAPAYATIYLHTIEHEIWTKIRTLPTDRHPILIKRYIDDIFAIFHSSESCQEYFSLYNQAQPSIKLEITHSGDTVNVLDLTY
jgi:hypothetical protein